MGKIQRIDEENYKAMLKAIYLDKIDAYDRCKEGEIK